MQPHQLHVVQRMSRVRRDRIVAEFHQQIVPLVEAKPPRIPLQRFQVFDIQVKVAPGRQHDAVAHKPLELAV